MSWMPWIQLAGAVLLVLGTAALVAFLRLADVLDAQAQAPAAAPARRHSPPVHGRGLAQLPAGASDDGSAYPRAA